MGRCMQQIPVVPTPPPSTKLQHEVGLGCTVFCERYWCTTYATQRHTFKTVALHLHKRVLFGDVAGALLFTGGVNTPMFYSTAHHSCSLVAHDIDVCRTLMPLPHVGVAVISAHVVSTGKLMGSCSLRHSVLRRPLVSRSEQGLQQWCPGTPTRTHRLFLLASAGTMVSFHGNVDLQAWPG